MVRIDVNCHMNNTNAPTPVYKVLMIDDDVKFYELMRDYLELRGFVIDAAHTGTEGIEKVRRGEYEAVILDVMMPGADGFEVLKEIRQFSSVPVLMLTALGDETDRIVGLEFGADDYLPKTFSARELLARLRAAIRRSHISQASGSRNEGEKISVQDIHINSLTREATKNSEQLPLTSLEFDLLLNLVRSAGKVLSRDTLLDAVAGRHFDFFDRSIDVHISSLRRKLDDDSKNPRYIKTIRSAGYMFVPEDTETAGS